MQKIEDGDKTGPGAGLGAGDPLYVLSLAACIDHAAKYGTPEAVADAAEAMGELVAGLELAKGINAKEAAVLRSAATGKFSDAVALDDGNDAYGIAQAAFDQGSETPRAGLSEKATHQRHSQLVTARETEVDAERRRVTGQVEFLTDALERTKSGEDKGALFERAALAPASHLQTNAPAEFQRLRATIKGELGADVLKEWEKELRKQEATKREENKRQNLLNAAGKSASAAKGGRAGEAAKEYEADNEPLDSRTAHEYGTAPAFDPTNEYTCGELLRLQNNEYAVVSIGGDFRVLEVTKEGRVTLENIRVPVPGKAQLVNSLDVWMKWPERTTYEGM